MQEQIERKFFPLILVVLDGWGIAPPDPGNAISLAKKPNYDFFIKNFPHTELFCSSEKVGLPHGQCGNSEAGHLNIGAGRVVKNDSVLINEAIAEGRFFKNPALLDAVNHARKNNSNIHLMGLLTNGQSAHAMPEHLYALLEFLNQQNFHKVYLHLFTDGRDSSRYAGSRLITKLMDNFKNNEIISSVMGRFYAMDRIKEWARTEKAYNAMVLGEGLVADNPMRAIQQAYDRGETDEFITPTIILNPDKKPKFIDDNDAVIFFNTRSDRARQIAKPFVQKDFEMLGGFVRKKILKNLKFISLTDFGPDLGGIITAFPPIVVKNSLPMALKKLRQLYIAEKEKYAHVTYFFNGGYADPIAGEKRKVIKSPVLSSYDLKPEMGAFEVTEYLEADIDSDIYDFITVNFANPDMVAHTGNLKATVAACEDVDKCLGRLYQHIKLRGGTMIITADHGNAEELINPQTGEIDTKHNGNQVPFIIVDHLINVKKLKLRRGGKLADIAPTILDMVNIKKPKEMTGISLLEK